MTQERQPTVAANGANAAGPSTALEALQAFKEAQERRVAHWKEYDEAQEHHERSNRVTAEGGEAREAEGTSNARIQSTHRCGGQQTASGASDSDHYHSVNLPMTDAIYAKILALVTSGLLDCSHSVRAIETELRTALARPDLASLVGQVQDRENGVLRKIVERDQSKRIARLEGRDMDATVKQLESSIVELRTEIQEVIAEINAEMSEL